MNFVARIYEAVKRRGYRKGYSAEEFVGRQAVKLVEEACELAQSFALPLELADPIHKARLAARDWFDRGRVPVRDPQELTQMRIMSEAADCRVVLACIQAGMEEIRGEPFLLETWALEKAQSDKRRGVR